MLSDWLPFQIRIDSAMVAGACLWAMALYLGLSGPREWAIEGLARWFNFAERSLYISAKEFEATRAARESQNAFYASVLSIVPFLLLGVLCNYGVELSLGRSWAISVGLIAMISSGVYELGRRTGANS
ncbi:MAG: hypothetical protein HC910_08915 [Spirulinaceae cyanobacterium SM2_1_0]|nr:hypothetical protein [Spirulinaceae cyanobacterium SM2_1_0]